MHLYFEATDSEYPLHVAASSGTASDVELLVQKSDIDPDQRDQYGASPLHWAAARGDKKMAQLLLDAGAYASACDNRGKCPRSCLTAPKVCYIAGSSRV